jgi:hypothetical protein
MFKFGPILADCYVLTTVGVNLFHQRNKLAEEVKLGKFDTLDMLHHLTSGLKSIYS